MVAPTVPFALVFAVAGVLPLVLLRPVLAHREKPGSTGFIFVIVGISLWSFGAAGLQTAGRESIGLAAFSLRMAGPLFSASGFFLLLGEYTGAISSTRKVIGAVLTFAVLVQAMIWTNSFHHLVFSPEVSLTAETIRFDKMGVVWVANTVVNYTFNTAAFVLGVVEVIRSRGIRRQQALAVIGAAIPPIGLNVLFQFWVAFPIDPTVLGFVATAFIMGWALYGEDFLNVVPVGRKRAVETMDDPVVVIDSENRIVDSNPAARSLVDCQQEWKGMQAGAFFGPFQEEVERFGDRHGVETEITVQQDGSKRYFDLNISAIRGPQGEIRGRLVALREITELKKRERDLNLMRQVQSRVLRHNIRNDLQLVRGSNRLFADELDGRHADLAAAAVDHCDNLLAMSSKARTLESMLDEDQSDEPVDMGALVRDVVEDQEDQFPGVSFTLDSPDNCVIQTTPAVKTAISNVVENAAEHNTEPAAVEVAVSNVAEGVVVSISDNGPGIPDEELEVLERGTETQLSHGSGLGLWAVDWVFDHADANVDYSTGSDGTTVTATIPDRNAANS